MPLSAERVKSFAEKCANLGKKLGVDVINLYSLFYEQPVSLKPNIVFALQISLNTKIRLFFFFCSFLSPVCVSNCPCKCDLT